MRGLLCGLLDESFGCGGPTLASELGQSQLSDVIQRTRVQWELFDYSNRPRTVSNANPAYVTAVFQRYGFGTRGRSAGIVPGVPKARPGPVAGAPPTLGDGKGKDPGILPGLAYLLPCPAMDYLWTPWRYAYVSSTEKTAGCVFCDAPKEKDDAKVFIVHRGEHCFVILNAYPYTPGHVMIVPYTHLDELRKLSAEAAQEMMTLSQRMESVLRELYHPDGINLGMNIGKAAGAGIAGHIHMHVLPRWVADANFVSVIGETRVLPETLEATWARMREAMGA
jgi:ATP adenylyltransferase